MLVEQPKSLKLTEALSADERLDLDTGRGMKCLYPHLFSPFRCLSTLVITRSTAASNGSPPSADGFMEKYDCARLVLARPNSKNSSPNAWQRSLNPSCVRNSTRSATLRISSAIAASKLSATFGVKDRLKIRIRISTVGM